MLMKYKMDHGGEINMMVRPDIDSNDSNKIQSTSTLMP